MGQNFLTCDRDQPLLLPPDPHDWLDEDHLAWFVIEAIEELDLDAFYASYRADGHGRAAHDPKMMLIVPFLRLSPNLVDDTTAMEPWCRRVISTGRWCA